MNLEKHTRKQRALDLRALIASNSHRFDLRDVCKEAKLPFKSTSVAISRLVRKDVIDSISDARLTRLEEAALRLEEQPPSLSKTG